jgi:hypothetical protein
MRMRASEAPLAGEIPGGAPSGAVGSVVTRCRAAAAATTAITASADTPVTTDRLTTLSYGGPAAAPAAREK